MLDLSGQRASVPCGAPDAGQAGTHTCTDLSVRISVFLLSSQACYILSCNNLTGFVSDFASFDLKNKCLCAEAKRFRVRGEETQLKVQTRFSSGRQM